MTKNHSSITDLIDLLTQEVPTPKPRELGFLDVAGKTTSETTICNVYRYFLDPDTSPEISVILKDTLLEIIAASYPDFEDKKDIDLDEYTVELERATGQGRIDIVLESEKTKSAVIIEAKIYHVLINNLEDYWNAVDCEDDRKIGVILGLHHHATDQIGHPEFVSITHSEWLNEAVRKGLSHQVPVKDFIYFKDFVNNMNHLAQSNEMTEEVQFYLKNADKINKAIKTKEEAVKFVIEQLQTVAGKMNAELHGSSDNWRNIWSRENKEKIYYTVYPNEITASAGKVTIIIELWDSAVAHKEELWKWARKDSRASQLATGEIGNRNFQQLLIKTIDVPIEDFENLAEKILTAINDLEPIRTDLFNELKRLEERPKVLAN